MFSPCAQVGDARCHVGAHGPLALHVAWAPAWNARHLSGVQYEVWVQELYKAWRTAETHLVLTDPGLVAGARLSVWVRAVTVLPRGAGGEETVVPGAFSAQLQCQL